MKKNTSKQTKRSQIRPMLHRLWLI